MEFNTHISLLNNRTPAKEIFIWDPKSQNYGINKHVFDNFKIRSGGRQIYPLKTTDTSFNKEEHIAKLFRDYEQAPGTIKYSSPPPPPPAQKKRSKNGQLDIFESLKRNQSLVIF